MVFIAKSFDEPLADFILGVISKLDLIYFMSSLKSNPLWAALSAYSGPYKTMK